ncbi:hypothetical protein, partial [Mesorhizobium sp. M3A.F.Ca.ET.201.01.1.1]
LFIMRLYAIAGPQRFDHHQSTDEARRISFVPVEIASLSGLFDADQRWLLGPVLRCQPRQVEHELATRARRSAPNAEIAKQ